MAAGLLVAFGAAVASGAGDAVLAGALAARLVAGLAARSHGVAVAGWWEKKINELGTSSYCVGNFIEFWSIFRILLSL